MRHLIDFGDLTRQEWDELYARASSIMDDPSRYIDACRGRVMASLFYEPSTRTNFSFQTAMLRLGGTVFGFADPNSSSVAKGETLKDTIKMVSGYADVVVMRTPWEGAAKAASLYSDVPVVNAGDGGHMHPPQTTADLTAITRLRGAVDGLNVGLCGDLKNGRTVHSLIKAMEKFQNVRFFLIAPRDLAVPEYLRQFMRERDMPFLEVSGLEPVIPQLDVLYMTRIQRERFASEEEYQRLKDSYILTPDKLAGAREGMMILHPLPRVNEIDPRVDDDPRAAYFRQAYYGRYIRMALILHLLGQAEGTAVTPDKGRPPYPQNQHPGAVCGNPHSITTIEQGLEQRFLRDGKTGEYRCLYCESKAE